MRQVSHENPEQEMWDAFCKIDADKSGYIDRDELKQLMISLGQKMTEDQIDAMVEEVDTNGDGKISYSEFVSMMSGA